MSNVATAGARAAKITSPKAAARLYNDLDYELALGELTPEQEKEAEAALADLDARFDGVREHAQEIETPPNLSRQAQRNVHGPPLGAQTRRRIQAQRRAGAGRVRTATAIHAKPRRSSSSPFFSSRRFGQTGIPATYESGTQLLMRTLGLIAGLSMLYLLLTPRGSRAVSLTSSGLTHGLRALVSPNVDPLRATTSAQAKARAAAAAKHGKGATPAQAVAGALGAVSKAGAALGGTAPGKTIGATPAQAVAGALGAVSKAGAAITSQNLIGGAH